LLCALTMGVSIDWRKYHRQWRDDSRSVTF
jgi:hypothetical protein